MSVTPKARFVALLLLLGALLAGCVTRASADVGCVAVSSAAEQPYACGGVAAGTFNMALPGNAATLPADPDSSAIIAQLVSGMAANKTTLDDGQAQPAIWIVNEALSSSYTLYTVTISANLDGDGNTSPLDGDSFVFPIPNGAVPGVVPFANGCEDGDCDDAMDIYDPGPLANAQNVAFAANPGSLSALSPSDVPTSDAELRLFHPSMDMSNHTITASGAGIFDYSSDSDGRPLAGTGTGSGLPWAGLIRPAEVAAGVIPHALRLIVPNVAASPQFRLPAISSDGDLALGNGSNETPWEYGMRVALPKSVDCESRTVPWDESGSDSSDPDVKLLHEICVALQDYGAIVVDQSGGPTYGVAMQQGAEVTEVSPTLVDGIESGPADWADWANWANPPCPPTAPYLLCTVPGTSAPTLNDSVGTQYWGTLLRDLPDENGQLFSGEPTSNAWNDGWTRSATDGIPWDRLVVLAASYFPAVDEVTANTANTSVTLSGSGFTAATGVAFGGVQTTFKLNSDSSITAALPSVAIPGSTVDVRVTGPGGTSPISTDDEFSYPLLPRPINATANTTNNTATSASAVLAALTTSTAPLDAAQLGLTCANASLALTDVVPRDKRIEVRGIAAVSLVGSEVWIESGTGVRLAHATVATDGFFGATVSSPRYPNAASYFAAVGSLHSTLTALTRRLNVLPIHASARGVVVQGNVVGPFSQPPANVEVLAASGCGTRAVQVATVKPSARGSFDAVVAFPPTLGTAIVTLSVRVRQSAHSSNFYAVPSLAQPVSAAG